MNLWGCLDCDLIDEFQSRTVVGVLDKDWFSKQTVFAAIVKNNQVVIVGYELTKEQMLKKSYFFTEKEIDEKT